MHNQVRDTQGKIRAASRMVLKCSRKNDALSVYGMSRVKEMDFESMKTIIEKIKSVDLTVLKKIL